MLTESIVSLSSDIIVIQGFLDFLPILGWELPGNEPLFDLFCICSVSPGPGQGAKAQDGRWLLVDQLQACGQNRLSDLWGPEQNKNAGFSCLEMKNHKAVTAQC